MDAAVGFFSSKNKSHLSFTAVTLQVRIWSSLLSNQQQRSGPRWISALTKQCEAKAAMEHVSASTAPQLGCINLWDGDGSVLRCRGHSRGKKAAAVSTAWLPAPSPAAGLQPRPMLPTSPLWEVSFPPLPMADVKPNKLSPNLT